MNIYDDYEQNRKIINLEEEIRTLKNKIEYITISLYDRDKRIALTKKENRKLEETNKRLKEDNDKLQTWPFKYSYIKKIKYENEKLKEENKKMKIIIKNNDIEQKADWKHIEELEEENKKLKEEIWKLFMKH